MSRPPRWRRALRLRRDDLRAGIEEELRFHLEMRAREHEERGVPPEEARRRAEARFGSVTAVAAACVDVDAGTDRRRRMGDWWAGLAQDGRTALRALRRSPGYATGVVATLAVGIAANVMIFSFLNAYFLRPLPFHEPDRLLHLFHVDAERGWDKARFSMAQAEDWRRLATSFEAMGTYAYGFRNFGGEGGAVPERVSVGRLSANAFDVLGAEAELGRTFAPGEEGPGAPAVVVLSHGLWQRRYGGDAGILGRTVPIDGVPHTVIGIMPARFNFPFGGVKAWTPTRASAADDRGEQGYLLFGRLAEGVTPATARAEAERVYAQLAAAHPQEDGSFDGVQALEMREALNFVYAMLRTVLFAMLATTFMVLLVAAANVAGLTLGRSLGRRRELAVRSAMGAGRGRLVRQLLVEGLLLAGVATAAGVALAHVAVTALGAAIPEDLYRVGDITVDGPALAFAALLALVLPLAFALVPAMAAARRDLVTALKEGTAGSGAGRGTTRARKALVVGQVAVALVLVAGAGLMLRSVGALSRVDLGFDPENVLTLQVSPPTGAYPDDAALRAYYGGVLERVEALPGVRAAGAIHPLPLNHETYRSAVRAPGEPEVEDGRRFADVAAVTPGYFAAMGMDLRAGRAFTAADREGAPPVAMVSRDLAAREWPELDPVGQRIVLGGGDAPAELTVVGVVDGVRHGDLDRTPDPQLYLPVAQSARRTMHIVVRGDGAPAGLAGPVRAVLADVDADLPAADVRPMTVLVREAGLQWGVPALVMGVLGAAAAALAALGVYGVIVVGVAQRRREIAIRRALGARPGHVGRAVVADGVRLAAWGAGLGLLAALVLARGASSLFYGVSAGDPLVFGGAAAAFLALALVAGAVPTWRALRIDPQEALRSE